MLRQSKSSKYSGLIATTDGLEATGDANLRGFRKDFAEVKLGADVINETETSGVYDWRLKRDGEIKTIVERDLGLKLIEAVRPVKVLVVELREPRKNPPPTN